MIPGLGRSPGEGKGYPLQYSGLENSLDYIVHGVAKSQTRLSNFHFTKKSVLGQITVPETWLLSKKSNSPHELGGSPGEGNGYPLQYSGLENSMDCIAHEVAKSQTQFSKFHFHFLICLSKIGCNL